MSRAKIFSAGVFLAMFLFDILPDFANTLTDKDKDNPVMLLSCFLMIIGSYLLMLGISKMMDDSGCPVHNEHNHSENEKSNLKLFIIFILHDFITGVLISFFVRKINICGMIYGLILHKIVEGLSLGIKFQSTDERFFINVLKFSVLSLFIFLGTILGNIFKESMSYLSNFSQCVIVGSFMYISLEECEMVFGNKKLKRRAVLKDFGVYMTGVALAFLIFNQEELFG